MPHPIADDPQVREAVEAVLADGSWCHYRGAAVEELESRLAERFGRRFVVPCSSGTLATELALRGLKIGAGDEVILCGYDFPGNFRGVEAVGARPVLVDSRPGEWSIDLGSVAAVFTPSCRAVIVSHLHGSTAPIREIVDWARPRGVAVVEDACQSPGATAEGKPVGGWGDCSTLSFGGSKLLTSGRGGAVMTDDARLAQRVVAFKDRGNDAFPLSVLQAAALLPQLEQLAVRHAARAAAADRLREAVMNRYSWASVPPAVGVPRDTSPAYYKFGVFARPVSERGGAVSSLEPTEMFRGRLLASLQAAGVPAGGGFMGFYRRCGSRARCGSDLANSRLAAAATVLVDHAALQPEGEATLLAALEKFDREL